MFRSSSATVLLVGLAATPLAAQGISSIQISGSTAVAQISLAGGVSAELRLEFGTVSGLSASSLGLQAALVDPSDLTLLARLPPGVGAVTTAFPVLVTIAPPTLGGLDFSNTVSISLHTENLSYVPGTPLRLFAAAANGPFADITHYVGSGSYRGRGDRGSFSEFLIAPDLRALDDVVDAKLDALDAALARHDAAITPAIADDLESLAETVRAEAENGDPEAAIDALDDWLALVTGSAGTDVPNRWRALRDVTNAAGELLSLGRTLRFSLALQAGS
jgi:hypothetical protein